MKKTTLVLVVLMLLAVTSAALADTWYCPQCGRLNDGNFCPKDGQANPLSSSSSSSGSSTPVKTKEQGLATQKLATRSGPATEYTEPGTFKVSGSYVTIVSIAYDENNVPWVQCELNVSGGLMRVYTGLKRFDTSTFNLDNVPCENYYSPYTAHVTDPCNLRYGPGNEYSLMSGYQLNAGKHVVVMTIENDWAQVEFTTSNGNLCRGWVPCSYLD